MLGRVPNSFISLLSSTEKGDSNCHVQENPNIYFFGWFLYNLCIVYWVPLVEHNHVCSFARNYVACSFGQLYDPIHRLNNIVL